MLKLVENIEQFYGNNLLFSEKHCHPCNKLTVASHFVNSNTIDKQTCNGYGIKSSHAEHKVKCFEEGLIDSLTISASVEGRSRYLILWYA